MANTNSFHKSVLTKEIVESLNIKPNGLYVDATFGGGGHSAAILNSEPTCKVIAIDWDKEAININAPVLENEYGNRIKIIWGNFAHLMALLKKEKINNIDGIIADFGTSQFQIHEKEGFSFQKDSPLDMRMSPAHQKTTAAYILNNASEQELSTIFFEYGEERYSRKIAKNIVEAREQKPITTTKQLAQLIEKLSPPGYQRIHPATRVFQALRIVVNRELDNINSFLISATKLLNSGGRIACISFHSLEDRMVKNFFKENSNELEIITKKPIAASEQEVATNPSSRSAKLRVAQKLAL